MTIAEKWAEILRINGQTKRGWAPSYALAWADSVHPNAEPYMLSPMKTCRECSKPERPVLATHGELCVYCDARDRIDEFETQCAMWNPGARAAQIRMDAADKRNAPRITAESRMLALSHPWLCDEGDP